VLDDGRILVRDIATVPVCRTLFHLPAYMVISKPPDSETAAKRNSVWVSESTHVPQVRPSRSGSRIKICHVRSKTEVRMEVSRLFKSQDLRSDDVVEILYALLRDSSETSLGADLTEPRPGDLLSTPNGVTHVVAPRRQKRVTKAGGAVRRIQ